MKRWRTIYDWKGKKEESTVRLSNLDTNLPTNPTVSVKWWFQSSKRRCHILVKSELVDPWCIGLWERKWTFSPGIQIKNGHLILTFTMCRWRTDFLNTWFTHSKERVKDENLWTTPSQIELWCSTVRVFSLYRTLRHSNQPSRDGLSEIWHYTRFSYKKFNN